MNANNKIILSKGWKPKISFDEGLKITIDWYKKFNNLYIKKIANSIDCNDWEDIEKNFRIIFKFFNIFLLTY